MNVLRFNGKDNRTALDQVRQQLGPDALILSSRRTAKGVEICATAALPDLSQARTATAVPDAQNEIQLAQLKRELAGLRETLQSALGDRRWQDTAGQRPVAATISQRLATLGIGRVFAGELADEIPRGSSLDQAWQSTLGRLTKRITNLSDAELAGFRVKLVVGTSGVGKTRSSIALLSEALRRHKPEDIAIIACGDPRQNSRLTEKAKALNLRTYAASDRKSLDAAIADCRWAREIIIDTPGLNPAKGSQDPVLSMLRIQKAGMGVFLVLPATGQAEHLHQISEHVVHLPVAGALITKVDEAVSLGGILDVVAGAQTPLAGRLRTDSETLVPVSGRELLTNAKRLTKRAMERRAAQLKVAV